MAGNPPPSAAAAAHDDTPTLARSGDDVAGGASEPQAQRQEQPQQQQRQRQQAPALDRPLQQEEAAASTEAPAPQQQLQQQQQPAAGPDSPTSPPLPGRPTATTAGPRATRLRETYAHALRRTLAKLASWDHFAGCYPTVAARAEPVLRQVQAQMMQKLCDKCEKEFDDILLARGVVPKLNELEALIADAAERRDASAPHDPEPTPLHLLPPAQILAAHLAAHLAPHQSQLNARLQTTQARNAELARAVARQRAELDALLARLDDAVADVRAANLALGPVADDLADEARAAAVDAP